MLIFVFGFVVYKVSVLVVAVAAFRIGGRDERQAAVVLIAAAIGGEIAAYLGDDFRTLAWRTLTIDGAILLALARLALRSDRFWPLWAAAFQLIGLLSHMPKLLQPDLSRSAYALCQQVWGFPILAAMAIGLWEASGRKAADGSR